MQYRQAFHLKMKIYSITVVIELEVEELHSSKTISHEAAPILSKDQQSLGIYL